MKSLLKGVTEPFPRWVTPLGGMTLQTAIKSYSVFTLWWEENKAVLCSHSYQRKTHAFHFTVLSCEGLLLVSEKGENEFTNVTLCKVWYDLSFLPCRLVFSIKLSIIFSLCHFRRKHRPFFADFGTRWESLLGWLLKFWNRGTLNGQVSKVQRTALCA